LQASATLIGVRLRYMVVPSANAGSPIVCIVYVLPTVASFCRGCDSATSTRKGSGSMKKRKPIAGDDQRSAGQPPMSTATPAKLTAKQKACVGVSPFLLA